MSASFIAAVVDTLLPGDSGGPEGEAPLPKASAAGINLALVIAHDAVLQAIAKEAGGADAFIAADEPVRIAAVQTIERAMPEVFRALLSVLLADYYESEPVLRAMKWRHDPPQPQGHQLCFRHPAIKDAIYRVHSRGKLWRE
ncbi:MAG: hypothetical protein ACKVOI_00325 [Dongiaceae bacterium]